MFGSSNPFGQSSSSPFGSTSGFGQTNSSNNNPFAPRPFGSSSPFGAQTGSSIFGATSTGVFGAAQSSSPLVSTPAFGAPSMPSFGGSAFGSSSTPAFGSGSSAFSGSSVFGQKPAFGGFGSTTTQASPFGSTFQQSQPAFGSNMFGSSSPFGTNSQSSFGTGSSPAFGATSTPAFGVPTVPAFGATSAPAFGAPATPSFGGANAPSFGSVPTQAFGTTSSTFGSSGTPSFGSSGATAFGASSASGFASSPTSAFGAASSPVFGPSSSNFGSSSTLNFGSSLAFGQSTSTPGSSPFGSNVAPFSTQSSPFGSHSSTFGSGGFGQSAVGGQPGGSRVVSYAPTAEAEGGTGAQPAGKLESISAMPMYKDKSHEELRWEDYQKGDKGGPNPTATGVAFGAASQSSPFATSSTFGTTGNPFSGTTSSNLFASKSLGSTGFGATSSPAFSSPFANQLSTPFASTTPSTSLPLFGSSATSSPSIFGNISAPAFGASTSPSIFGSASAPGSGASFGSALNFANTQSSGLFQSPAPSIGQTPAFGSSVASFGQSTSAFGQPNPFANPSTGFGGNLFANNSSPSLLNASNPVPFGQTTPSLSTSFPAPLQTSGSFTFGNLSQSQPASNNIGISPNVFGQSAFTQSSTVQNNVVTQAVPVMNPFGTLPVMPQMSIGRSGPTSSIQYGISNMPVTGKPLPTRVSSLVTSRNFPSRRIRLSPRHYYPKSDGPKVPFFGDEERPSTPKADALFIPRENPRALVIRPLDQWPSRISAEKELYHESAHIHENDDSNVGEETNEQNGKYNDKSNGFHHEENGLKGDSFVKLSGQRAGEAAIAYEHGADIEAMMPKLRHSDYYTEPRIQELAAKERAEPGYCRRVKDFVVGRNGYGSIKFFGETDVRRLDLESLVQFNNKEVIVFMDETKKPPVGQGLNKPAEITLLNIRCLNKKTAQQYVDGPKVEKYKLMLMKKAQGQGADFVSYDPVIGEWKFRVNHF